MIEATRELWLIKQGQRRSKVRLPESKVAEAWKPLGSCERLILYENISRDVTSDKAFMTVHELF